MEDTKSRNQTDVNFQMGFDYAHGQVVGYHTDEARMIDPEQWPTISELVANIIENGIEEVIIDTEYDWDLDIVRGIACFATTLRHEIYFYMTDHGLYDVTYPEVFCYEKETIDG